MMCPYLLISINELLISIIPFIDINKYGLNVKTAAHTITLNTRAERRKLLNKNTRTRVDTQMIGTKKNTFSTRTKKQVYSNRRT